MTTVKVRFQDPNTSARYSGTFSALSTIIKEERFSGLYKGIMSPMVCVLSVLCSVDRCLQDCTDDMCAFEWTSVF